LLNSKCLHRRKSVGRQYFPGKIFNPRQRAKKKKKKKENFDAAIDL